VHCVSLHLRWWVLQSVSEKNFLDAVNKVIKGYAKFSATPKYMVCTKFYALILDSLIPGV